MFARFNLDLHPESIDTSSSARHEERPQAVTVESAPPRNSQHAVFVPEHYEAKYPYPLIVWVQSGKNPREMQQVLPLISERNYFGLALSLDQLCRDSLNDNAQDEHDPRMTMLERTVYQQVCSLRREFHIHSERIYLAGFGEGATHALQLGLAKPEWFAGVISLAGHTPATPHLLRRFRDLGGKRVLLGVGAKDRTVSVNETVQLGRLLHSAGMNVLSRVYEGSHQISRPMLRDINHWVMQDVCETQCV